MDTIVNKLGMGTPYAAQVPKIFPAGGVYDYNSNGFVQAINGIYCQAASTGSYNTIFTVGANIVSVPGKLYTSTIHPDIWSAITDTVLKLC